MISNDNRWKKLFLFCLGLTLGTAFCMKWMEGDMYVNGKLFTIMGLELFYPRQQVVDVLSALQPREATILNYHLNFDFAFMAGVFPGITALCMMARQKLASRLWQRIFFFLAVMQMLAWGCDIAENSYLLKWVEDPASIPASLDFFHALVSVKWIIALVAAVPAIPVVVWLSFSRR
jgi:hypothetical protein